MVPTPTGTASCMYFPRLRTVRTASAKVDSARSHVRGILTQAVAGDKTRLGYAALERSQRRDGYGKNRRLGDFGETQLVFWSIKADLRQFVAERFVGFFEGLPRYRIFFGELFAHAYSL